VACGAVAVPFILVGGVLILVVGGAGAVVKGVKSTVDTHLPDKLQARIGKAQLAVEEAERLVENASLEVQQQERKWFNYSAIEDANKSLAAKRALLAKAQEHLEELTPGEVESKQATLQCCSWTRS
jgi:hypothetical protein